MTTKPRASKFRIRRTGNAARPSDAGTPAAESGMDPTEASPKVVRRKVPLSMKNGDPSPASGDPSTAPKRSQAGAGQAKQAIAGLDREPSPATGATDIHAIRQEGLTGRQLRMARRVAQKNGIAATSDFEAVKLLREAGIDPFQTSSALELVVPSGAGTAWSASQRVQLPQTVPAKDTNTSPAASVPAQARAEAIRTIQKDIARRRQRKTALLFARLAVFVGLPTLVFGYYFAFIATPMYGTTSAFLIQQNEASAAGGGLAGMFGSNQLATVQDSIAVQGYLQSREAMLRLNDEHGFKAHFQNPELDAISRLSADATNEEAYGVYKRHVKIGYDPTEGIITMEVIATSPEASQTFSNALISYAEGEVSDLSLRLRNDQMRGARESFAEAELNRQEAVERLVALQTELQTVDATGVIAATQSRIAAFETQLEEKRIELQAQLANRRPNESRVEGIEAEISRLEESISSQRARLTQASEGGQSLASIQAQIQIAQIDFTTRDAMLQQALQALEASRIAADRQVRYIAISTPPTAPDEPTYPRVFENTFLAFLIFSGIYLMISLTASILREQVSS